MCQLTDPFEASKPTAMSCTSANTPEVWIHVPDDPPTEGPPALGWPQVLNLHLFVTAGMIVMCMWFHNLHLKLHGSLWQGWNQITTKLLCIFSAGFRDTFDKDNPLEPYSRKAAQWIAKTKPPKTAKQ